MENTIRLSGKCVALTKIELTKAAQIYRTPSRLQSKLVIHFPICTVLCQPEEHLKEMEAFISNIIDIYERPAVINVHFIMKSVREEIWHREGPTCLKPCDFSVELLAAAAQEKVQKDRKLGLHHLNKIKIIMSPK